MRSAAIMTAAPYTVRASDSVAAAAALLIGERQLSLPVVDAEGRYVGMFGMDDLLRVVVPRVALAGHLAPNIRFVGDDPRQLAERFDALKDHPVGEIADRAAPVLTPETPAIEAFRSFCASRKVLPVVDSGDGRLVGLVSYWDVMGTITAAA